jgi:quercetin dioxygenase-like cupin family protein
MRCYRITELKPRRPADGLEIRAIHGEKMTMAFYRMSPGSEIPEHAHPHEQMGTVLRGSVELTINGEKTVVSDGGAYHVPPNVVHSGRCRERETEVLEVFSPVRDDFK